MSTSSASRRRHRHLRHPQARRPPTASSAPAGVRAERPPQRRRAVGGEQVLPPPAGVDAEHGVRLGRRRQRREQPRDGRRRRTAGPRPGDEDDVRPPRPRGAARRRGPPAGPPPASGPTTTTGSSPAARPAPRPARRSPSSRPGPRPSCPAAEAPAVPPARTTASRTRSARPLTSPSVPAGVLRTGQRRGRPCARTGEAPAQSVKSCQPGRGPGRKPWLGAPCPTRDARRQHRRWHRRRSEWKVQMLRNLGIRWQILSALALPVLVLALVAGQATYASVREMREADEALDLSAAAASFTALVTGLQGERLLTAGRHGRLARTRQAQLEGRPRPDRRRRPAAPRADLPAERPAVQRRGARRSSSSVSAAHDTLPEIRELADSGKATPAQVVARYDEIIELDLRVPRPGRPAARRTSEVQQELRALLRADASRSSRCRRSSSRASSSRCRNAPRWSSSRSSPPPGASADEWLAEFDRSALPEQKAFLAGALEKVEAQTASYESAKAKFQAAGTRRNAGVVATLWTATTQARIAAINSVLGHVAEDGTDARPGRVRRRAPDGAAHQRRRPGGRPPDARWSRSPCRGASPARCAA